MLQRAYRLSQPLSTRDEGSGAPGAIGYRHAAHLIDINKDPEKVEHGDAEHKERSGEIDGQRVPPSPNHQDEGERAVGGRNQIS